MFGVTFFYRVDFYDIENPQCHQVFSVLHLFHRIISCVLTSNWAPCCSGNPKYTRKVNVARWLCGQWAVKLQRSFCDTLEWADVATPPFFSFIQQHSHHQFLSTLSLPNLVYYVLDSSENCTLHIVYIFPTKLTLEFKQLYVSVFLGLSFLAHLRTIVLLLFIVCMK